MTAPTAPTTAPNRADGAEGSDYATTAPTAPSPIGRGGVVGAVARMTAGSNLQKRTRRGRAPARKPVAGPPQRGAQKATAGGGDLWRMEKRRLGSLTPPELPRKPSKTQNRCIATTLKTYVKQRDWRTNRA